MKNKAKWTALLMCGLLVLGGCGTTTDNNATDITDIVNQATEAPSDTAKQLPVPAITVLPEEKIWYAEDDITLLTVKEFTLSIEGDGFSTLQASFDNYHPGIIPDNYQLLYEEAKDHYEFNLSPGYFNGYSSNTSAELSRCDSSVVSFRILYSDYTGGAHGMYANWGETYEVETGTLLTLADIVADAESFYPNAIEYVNNALHEEYEDGLFANYQSWVEESLSPDNEPLWYMTAAGIVICFTPYDVGPYAMGAPEITLPYSEFASYLHSKYLPTNGELVARVELNQDISSLIGTDEPIMIEGVENEWQLDISLTSGSHKATLGTFNTLSDAYIIKRADNRSFIMITCGYWSEDFITYFYEITNGNLLACNELPQTQLTGRVISSKNIEMSIAINALGSYGGYTNYTLTSDGHLVHNDELYQITSPYPLNIIKPLPVTIDDTKTTLDAGTQITITGTNLVDEIYFKVVGTETTGTIFYTHDSPDGWIFYIDGVSEYEYFDNLPYAG